MIHLCLRAFLRPPRERLVLLVDRRLEERLRPRLLPRLRPLSPLRRGLRAPLVVAPSGVRAFFFVLRPGEGFAQAHRAPKLITPSYPSPYPALIKAAWGSVSQPVLPVLLSRFLFVPTIWGITRPVSMSSVESTPRLGQNPSEASVSINTSLLAACASECRM